MKKNYIKNLVKISLALLVTITHFNVSINNAKALENNASMMFFRNRLYSSYLNEGALIPSNVYVDSAPPYSFVQESAYFNKVTSNGYNLYKYYQIVNDVLDTTTQGFYGYNTTYYNAVQDGAINYVNTTFKMYSNGINVYNLPKDSGVTFYDRTRTNKLMYAYRTYISTGSSSSAYEQINNNAYNYTHQDWGTYKNVYTFDGQTIEINYNSINWNCTAFTITVGGFGPGSTQLLQIRFTPELNSGLDINSINIEMYDDDSSNSYANQIKLNTIAYALNNVGNGDYILSILYYMPVANSYKGLSRLTFYIDGVGITNFYTNQIQMWTSYNTTAQQVVNLYDFIGNYVDYDRPNNNTTPNDSEDNGGSSGGNCTYNFNELKTYLTEQFQNVINAINNVSIDNSVTQNITNIYNNVTNNYNIENELPSTDNIELPTIDLTPIQNTIDSTLTNITTPINNINSGIITPIWQHVLAPMRLDYAVYIAMFFTLLIALKKMFL